MRTLEQSMDETMGPIGTPRRDQHEIKHLFWLISYHTKIRRKEFGFSHEDLAARTGLTVKEIAQVERCGINTPSPNVHKLWKQLGIVYDGEFICYFDPEWTKQKPPLKRKLTKPSSSLRRLAR